jgi:hypothetical protein
MSVQNETKMIKTIQSRVALLPDTRIKKLWSSGINRDIDILVVCCGLAGFYEIKVTGERPTPWQLARLKWWADSGADTAWFDSVGACLDRIKALLDRGRAVQAVLADFGSE